MIFPRLFVLALGAGSLVFGQSTHVASVRARFARQVGSPLLVLGTRMDMEDLYKNVYVVNDSDQRITRAQLSWIIADAQHQERFVIMSGTPFDLNLDPGEIREVGRQGAAMSLVQQTLDKLGATNGLLKLGVVDVVFENGKEWTYPLALRGKFEENDGTAIALKYAEKLKEFNESRKGAAHTTQSNGAGCLSPDMVKFVKAANICTGQEDCGG